jgi:outer membrane protein
MNVLSLSRWWVALASAVALLPVSESVWAQQMPGDSIYTRISPSIRDRAFMRLSYISANVKTTSGDAYDVTGPVIKRGEIASLLGTGSAYATGNYYVTNKTGLPSTYRNIISTQLDDALTSEASATGCASMSSGIGTPCGIKAKASSMVGTPALSVGYFLTDEYTWMVEAYVLAAPLDVSVYGDGNNHLNGKNIINLKLLPPTAVLGRYFGDAKAKIRPFVGLGGSYAVFFDVRATDALNNYVGGSSAGDTSVSIKNALGFGPFVGMKAQLDDAWHISLNVGKLRYKTEATLTTRNTVITSNSEVLLDYGDYVRQAISASNAVLNSTVKSGNAPTGYTAGQSIAGTTALMCDLARARTLAQTGTVGTSCNLGTYVRKQSTVLDNTMVMLSVGRQF